MADGSKAPVSTFEKLLAVDVSRYVEKKGKFSYLSWSYAVAELGRVSPTATWDIGRFPLPSAPHLLVPYCETPTGFYVEVIVTVDGVKKSQVHPVLDERNNVIKAPNAFDINRATQRALVKAIGLHGLGLNVYAGEDLPLGDGEHHDDHDPADRKKEAARSINASAQRISKALDALGITGAVQRTNAVNVVLKREPVTDAELEQVAVALEARAAK